MNYLVCLYADGFSYQYHTIFAQNEGEAWNVAGNLASQLASRPGQPDEWDIQFVEYIDDEA